MYRLLTTFKYRVEQNHKPTIHAILHRTALSAGIAQKNKFAQHSIVAVGKSIKNIFLINIHSDHFNFCYVIAITD